MINGPLYITPLIKGLSVGLEAPVRLEGSSSEWFPNGKAVRTAFYRLISSAFIPGHNEKCKTRCKKISKK